MYLLLLLLLLLISIVVVGSEIDIVGKARQGRARKRTSHGSPRTHSFDCTLSVFLFSLIDPPFVVAFLSAHFIEEFAFSAVFSLGDHSITAMALNGTSQSQAPAPSELATAEKINRRRRRRRRHALNAQQAEKMCPLIR